MRTRHPLVPLLILLGAVVAGCAPRPVTPPPPAPQVALPGGFDTTVERVVDGDTVVVSGGRHVRLIGVDTTLI